jgi:P4 family phage/plasmid primase-like protien
MRLSDDGARLVLPWRDIQTSDITTIQYIAGDGEKRWHSGAPKRGGYLIAPDVADGPCIICEGAATACSVYEAMSGDGPLAVIAAGDAGSLRQAAEAARKRWPGRAVFIGADDDWQREQEPGRNPGLDAAREIERAGLADGVLAPPFSRHPGAGDKRSDWNDFSRDYGVDAAREALTEAIREAVAAKDTPPDEAPDFFEGVPPEGGAVFDCGVKYERNDSGNAKRLISAHGEDMRYCEAWKRWLVWDGLKWDDSSQCAAARLAHGIAEGMLLEARSMPDIDDKAQRAAVSFAIQSGNTRRVNSMLEAAQSVCGMPITPEALNKNAYLLNCLNGTVDLRTGGLMPPRREDYITRAIPVEYDPHARCPQWERFLFQIMGGKKHLVEFLQRVAGYCLTGDTSEQCMFILHGSGANGKSTFLNVLQNVLGCYAKAAESQVFIEKKNDDATFYALASLWGARMVTSIETGEGRKLDEPLIKQATGGDIITCRRMREDFWQYMPEFKLFFATNHRPIIKGTDNGIWRRIRLVPFEVVVPDSEQDKQLTSKLLKEVPGILAWGVRGCIDWRRGGLREPDDVLIATREYRDEQDTLGAFLDECCLIGPEYHDTTQNLYHTYTRWAKDNGVFIWSCKKLMMELAGRGFEEHRNMYSRGRRGLIIKPGYESVINQSCALSR